MKNLCLVKKTVAFIILLSCLTIITISLASQPPFDQVISDDSGNWFLDRVVPIRTYSVSNSAHQRIWRGYYTRGTWTTYRDKAETASHVKSHYKGTRYIKDQKQNIIKITTYHCDTCNCDFTVSTKLGK